MAYKSYVSFSELEPFHVVQDRKEIESFLVLTIPRETTINTVSYVLVYCWESDRVFSLPWDVYQWEEWNVVTKLERK